MTHVCFADDLMVFVGADIQSNKLVQGVLDLFKKVSDLCANPLKSEALLVVVPSKLKHQIF